MDQRRITSITASLLMLAAGFFDVLSVVPVLDIIMAFVGWFIFWLWFLHLGIGNFFNSPRRLAAPVISFFVEIIPVLSAIPSFTLAVGTTIGIISYEDWQKAKKQKASRQEAGESDEPIDDHYEDDQILSRPNNEAPQNNPNQVEQPSAYGQTAYSQPSNIYKLGDIRKPKPKNDNEQNPYDIAA